jgi:beta-barrel assembly-enhancing protease
MRPILIALLSTLAVTAGTGCASTSNARIKAETALASALISDADEEKLGMQVKQELEKKGVKYVQDGEVVAYVQGVANRLLPHASRERKGVRWRIHVIDDAKTVNAFATPGGFLYVYTGLILNADNEAELAGVLAHEAGHVVARHSARKLVNAYGLQSVLGLAMGKNPGMLSQVAGAVLGQGVLLAHGRGEEIEADEAGARYTAKANYDPKGLATFFQKLKAKEGKTPAALTWLSTHPATSDRITNINEYIAKNNLRGSDLGADRIAAIKQRLGGARASAEQVTRQ